MGAAAPQSELAVHWAQRPTRARQRGTDGGQSVLDAHSTHLEVVALHTTALGGQSAFDLHPRHWPLVGSQIRSSLLHDVATTPLGVEHEGWHR
jgi:hypothetical protein